MWWNTAKKRRARQAEALRQFADQRDRLEAEFFEKAAATGKPRGLRWKQCEFNQALCFARDRATGQLTALVGVTISFEAIEGGPMEDVEAVGNLRAASAVFRHDGQRWGAEGRALFNLEPDEAVQYCQGDLELLDPSG